MDMATREELAALEGELHALREAAKEEKSAVALDELRANILYMKDKIEEKLTEAHREMEERIATHEAVTREGMDAIRGELTRLAEAEAAEVAEEIADAEEETGEEEAPEGVIMIETPPIEETEEGEEILPEVRHNKGFFRL